MKVIRRGILAKEKNSLVKEKMLEIAGILGIVVEGRIEEIRTCIRGMTVKEFGHKKGYENLTFKKSQKGPGR